jgi:Domain of unknown function (DUF6362)
MTSTTKGAITMANASTSWTSDAVAARFESAAYTARTLPGSKVQGHFNVWPQIVRSSWERLSADDERPKRYFPPSPQAVELMLETMKWVLWLEEEQRHLVWMRAKRHAWRDITRRFGCDRTTAWRRWNKALQMVADQLNGGVNGAV